MEKTRNVPISALPAKINFKELTEIDFPTVYKAHLEKNRVSILNRYHKSITSILHELDKAVMVFVFEKEFNFIIKVKGKST